MWSPCRFLFRFNGDECTSAGQDSFYHCLKEAIVPQNSFKMNRWEMKEDSHGGRVKTVLLQQPLQFPLTPEMGLIVDRVGAESLQPPEKGPETEAIELTKN